MDDFSFVQKICNRLELDYIKIIDRCTFENNILMELDLSRLNLTDLPEDIFNDLVNLQKLDLSNNKIKYLKNNVFHQLINLKELYIDKNPTLSLEDSVFKNLINLFELRIEISNIVNHDIIPIDLFNGLKLGLLTLKTKLSLSKEFITNLKVSSIYLTLSKIPENIFEGKALRDLSIHGLKNLRINTFRGLSVKNLYLTENSFDNIPEKIFDDLDEMEILDLSNNKIKKISKGVFDNLINLLELDLSVNRISKLPNNIFDRLVNLELLNLSGNNLNSFNYNNLSINF